MYLYIHQQLGNDHAYIYLNNILFPEQVIPSYCTWSVYWLLNQFLKFSCRRTEIPFFVSPHPKQLSGSPLWSISLYLNPVNLNVQLLWIYKTYSINILCEGNYESWELGTGRYVDHYLFWIIFCSKFTYNLYEWYYIFMCGVAIWGTEQWSGLYEVIQLLIIKKIYLFILLLKYYCTQGIVIDIKL